MIIFELPDTLTGGFNAFSELLVREYDEEIAALIEWCCSSSAPIPNRGEFRQPYVDRLFRGELSESEFFETVISSEPRLVAEEVTPSDVQRIFSQAISTLLPGSLKMLRLIEERPYMKDGRGGKIVFVADGVKEEIPNIVQKNPNLFAIAGERCAWSHELGIKRDEGYFARLRERFPPAPSEIAIYVDRSIINVDNAKQAGYRGIRYRDPSQLISDLDRVFS